MAVQLAHARFVEFEHRTTSQTVMPSFLPDLLGFFGAALVVMAYFLNQSGKLASTHWRFPAINLFGCAFILVSLVENPNPASILIEIFWGAISLYGLQKALRRSRT